MRPKQQKIVKRVAFGTLMLIATILMVATVVEKFVGSNEVTTLIYTAPWMVLLWGVMVIASIVHLFRQGVQRRFATFLLHISFVVILIGAVVTHITSQQGKIHLRQGDAPTSSYVDSNQHTATLPFALELESFELAYYNGTFAPMDYISNITLYHIDGAQVLASGTVSMNNIYNYKGYRFYQFGYDADSLGATLALLYDPYGIAITYIGYALLLLSMLLFLFQRRSMLRKLLSHPALRRGMGMVVALFLTNSLNATPTTLPKDVAKEFGQILVYHNDRVTLLQTLAQDFTAKLYGKSSYCGLTAEQVMCGWFFFYDEWKSEEMIKIKGADVRTTLGIEGRYASLNDFTDKRGYKLSAALRGVGVEQRSNYELANEKFNIVSMLSVGSLLNIYPYTDSISGITTWFSLADRLPLSIPADKRLFISSSMNLVAEQVAQHDYDAVLHLIEKILQYQRNEAEGAIPTSFHIEAEHIYNQTNFNRIIAMFCLVMGIIGFIFYSYRQNSSSRDRLVERVMFTILLLVSIYLTLHIALRGVVSHHIPLSNGFETMQFMAWCATIFTLIFYRRVTIFLPFGYLITGMTMLVAMMGEATPQITNLMPVLQSPLLSIHVVVIMIAYTLFAFIMLNGVMAIILHLRGERGERGKYLYLISRIMLYPALFLLTAGIFVGAVWANVSWGRYWGWDPKEVWALITMIVYSFAIHQRSLPILRSPIAFHIYSVVAFLTVIITYFGVNFILGGMHGYA